MNLNMRRSIERPKSEPFRESLQQLKGRMDALYEEMMARYDSRGQRMPSVDVKEDQNNYWILMEVPGVGINDLELSIMADRLMICGVRKPSEPVESQYHHLRERRMGLFRRTITLPPHADSTGVEATLKNGVVTVRLPKSKHHKAPLKVKVASGKSERGKYIGQVEAQIREWASRLDQLQARAEEKSEGLKKKYYDEVEHLKRRVEEAKARFSELKDSSGETWDLLKNRLEVKLGEVESLLKEKFKRLR